MAKVSEIFICPVTVIVLSPSAKVISSSPCSSWPGRWHHAAYRHRSRHWWRPGRHRLGPVAAGSKKVEISQQPQKIDGPQRCLFIIMPLGWDPAFWPRLAASSPFTYAIASERGQAPADPVAALGAQPRRAPNAPSNPIIISSATKPGRPSTGTGRAGICLGVTSTRTVATQPCPIASRAVY